MITSKDLEDKDFEQLLNMFAMYIEYHTIKQCEIMYGKPRPFGEGLTLIEKIRIDMLNARIVRDELIKRWEER